MNLPRPKVNQNYEGFAALVDRVTVRVASIRREEMFFSKAIALALIKEFVQEVGDVAEKTGRCAVPGLGVVYKSKSKARNVRNPATKEPMRLPGSWRLSMRAAKNRKGPLGEVTRA